MELSSPEALQLSELIHKAFDGVELGRGISLRAAEAMDDYADARTLASLRARDEQRYWENISSEELDECSNSLSFFDAEGMRFHLPAYLLADLRGELTRASLLFHLTYSGDHAMSRFSALSKVQRAAVRAFLEYQLTVRNWDDFDRPMIETALKNGWRID